jgi:hypothetical protein
VVLGRLVSPGETAPLSIDPDVQLIFQLRNAPSLSESFAGAPPREKVCRNCDHREDDHEDDHDAHQWLVP